MCRNIVRKGCCGLMCLRTDRQFFKNSVSLPWPGGLVVWSIAHTPKGGRFYSLSGCGFDPGSGHLQEATD